MTREKRILWIFIFSTIVLMSGISTTKHLRAKAQIEDKKVVFLEEIELSHSNQSIYEKFQGGLLRYSEGLLFYYNQKGEQQWSTHLGIINPMIRANESYIYIVDKSRNQLINMNNKGQVSYRITLERPLFDFVVCNENYILIQHISKDALQYVTILNEKGKKNGEIVLGDGEVITATVSKAHNRVGIATLGAGANGLESRVLMYDLKGKLIGIQGMENQVVLNLSFDGKGNLVSISEDRVISIDNNNSVNWDVSLDPVHLIKSSGTYPVVVYSKEQGRGGIIRNQQENRVRLLHDNGKWLGETRFEENIKGMDIWEDAIVAFSDRTIYMIDKRGSVKVGYAYNQDIEKVKPLTQGNVAVITKEKIAFIRFE